MACSMQLLIKGTVPGERNAFHLLLLVVFLICTLKCKMIRNNAFKISIQVHSKHTGMYQAQTPACLQNDSKESVPGTVRSLREIVLNKFNPEAHKLYY